MAGVISVPANEGVSVKNEHDDPEIDAMALKMKETFEKTASAAAKQLVTSPANVYINRAGRSVPVTVPVPVPIPVPVPQIAPPTENAPEEELPENVPSEDHESARGRFGYKAISTYAVPYITRIINGEKLRFVSVRMAETQLLSSYLHYLHSDIYTCTLVRSYYITEAEAKVLNELNLKHCDATFGKDPFVAAKDYIVRLEDVHEFYTFIEICYKKLLCHVTLRPGDKCGFIRINSESVVPYCIKDDQKYVPLFYFEGETENLRHRAVKLENWDLAYLKFCCKVQGIRNELFASDSCTVTSLDDIKNYFPPETNFEEYWPAKVVDTQLLTNLKNAHTNPPGAWIRVPPAIVPAPGNIIPQPLIAAPAPPVVPQSMPVMMNTYQAAWPANQMVNSYSAPAQPAAVRAYAIGSSRNQNMAQCYNTGSTIMPQGSSSMNNVGHVPPPPLVRVGNNPPVIGNSASYPNSIPISQCMTTMYNAAMSNSTVMSQNHMRHFYNIQRASNGQAQQQLQQQQQQQQQQLITTPQTYGVQSMQHGRLTNTQQRNALRPAMVTPTEIIDLSSPPSSPVPPTLPEPTQRPGFELKRIPERIWGQDTSNTAAYKIQKATIQGKMIHCINSKAYLYSDLMVTLEDLVQQVLPTCSVSRCAHLLVKYLKTTLYSGNSEQLAVLRENGRLRSINPEDTPMAMLQDITHVWLQLKSLVSRQDDPQQQVYQLASGPAKRQRTS